MKHAPFILLLVSSLCMLQAAHAQQEHLVQIELCSQGLPDGARVYVTGNHPFLGDWQPDSIAMRPNGAACWKYLLQLVEGTRLEYKFTLGSWESQALGLDGAVSTNHVAVIRGPTSLVHRVDRWLHGVPASIKRKLEPVGTIEGKGVVESSGIITSRKHPGVLWTHNDSGDEPRLYPIRMDGSSIPAGNAETSLHRDIVGARHVDWEDIAMDIRGQIYIADVGNNENTRTDLVIYVVEEPDDLGAVVISGAEGFAFKYPEQDGFPPQKLNFDAEAIFWVSPHLYLLTKHRSDTMTTLYRLEAQPGRLLEAVRVGEYDIRGMVTAADASADGSKLVVLTYDAIWLFTRSDSNEPFFDGAVTWLPIQAGQCEAIVFLDEQTLLMTNEKSDLFVVPLAELETATANAPTPPP